jgi:hypothetical protein
MGRDGMEIEILTRKTGLRERGWGWEERSGDGMLLEDEIVATEQEDDSCLV